MTSQAMFAGKMPAIHNTKNPIGEINIVMAITKDDVVEYLKGMTLLEASELVKELEEVFGVSAAAAAAPVMVAAAGAGAGGDGGAAAAEEKDAFDVILQAAGGNK